MNYFSFNFINIVVIRLSVLSTIKNSHVFVIDNRLCNWLTHLIDPILYQTLVLHNISMRHEEEEQGMY